jgi:hypothetical protein
MSDDGADKEVETAEAVRLALRGWQQRIQAVIEIARDDDDLPARLPVLDAVASDLVAALTHAVRGLDNVAALPVEVLPLRLALGQALVLLRDIELWHRPPSVAALRKARDHFRVTADRLQHASHEASDR